MDIVTGQDLPIAVREFTDREEPRAAFWKKFHAVEEAHARKEKKVHVLSYYGVGGIGKSSLLKKLQAEMKEKDAAAFFSDWDFKDGKESRAVLERLKNKLEDQFKIPFPLFDYAHYVYARKLGENPDSPKVKSIIGESSFLSWCMSAADPIPVVGLASKLLQLADQGVAMVRDHLKKHSTTVYRIESMEADHLLKELPVLFAKDLTVYMEKSQKPLVIFLDTYESLVNELLPGDPLNHDLWLRDIKTGLLPRVPYVLWVIAGREKLKWERFYEGWKEGLEQHLLGDLSETDSIKFLETAGIPDEKLRKVLYRLTGGTPMYLDLCVTQYENILAKGETPAMEHFGADTEELLHRFLSYMVGAQKDVMYILACVEWWDDSVIFEITKKAGLAFSVSDYELIKSMSFVLPGDKGGYCLHQTVGDVLRQKAPKHIKEQIAQGLNKTYREVVFEASPLSETHADALSATLREGMLTCEEDEALRLFYAEHLKEEIKKIAEAGQFEYAIGLMEPLIARATQNENSLLYAEMLIGLAWIKRLAGQYTEAKDLAERSRALYAELTKEDDLDTIRATGILASVLEELGEYKKARILQEQVLETRKRILGEDHPDTLASMNNLATIFRDLGLYNEERERKEEVLRKRKQILGEDHPDTLGSMNNLAITLRNLGEHTKAKALQEEVLEKQKRIWGEDHPSTLVAMNNLALTLRNLGEYAEAKVLQEEVLKKRKQILGENHPSTLVAMNNLTLTLRNLREYTKAKALQEQVLQARKRILGENHPDTLGSMNNLALTLRSLGEYTEARKLQEEVLRKRKQILGEDHPETLKAMNNLAIAFEDLGEHKEAEVLYEEVLYKRKRILGENHPSTIRVANNLLLCLKKIGIFRNFKRIRELKAWLKGRK